MQIPEIDFAQLVGMLSFALGILCFYQKDDKNLKVMMVLMLTSHALHFALLGALIASLTSILSVLRTIVSLKTSSPLVAYVFIALTSAIGLYLFKSWVDILPIIGACIGTYALFCMQGIAMRIAFTVGGLCWLANNILVGSIGTTLLELVIFIVNLLTIYRLYREQNA